MDKNSLPNRITLEGDTLTVVSGRIARPCRVMILGDTHFSTDDERGEPFRRYSARMAQYGRQEMTALEDRLKSVEARKIDAVILAGDIISFPSEAGVEKLLSLMRSCPVPCYYTAGNHDWHYEGTAGSDRELREEWIGRRLLPLYAGRNPLYYAETHCGIKFILIDNSVYQILPEQLDFLKAQLSDGRPAILAMHIPLYLPGRGSDYPCGNPQWGKEDPYYQIERRERWPESGPSQTTLDFHRLALSAPNVLGIVAGHTHQFDADQINGRFQLVAAWGGVPAILNLLPAGSSGAESVFEKYE